VERCSNNIVENYMAIFTRSEILTTAEFSIKVIYASEVSFQESVAGISLRNEGKKDGRVEVLDGQIRRNVRPQK
jgi:hypothetical protein